MADELERLRAWKAEAIEVLNGWEHAWEAAGQPGPLGPSKALAVATALEQMKADLAEALQLLNHQATAPLVPTGDDHDHPAPTWPRLRAWSSRYATHYRGGGDPMPPGAPLDPDRAEP